MNLNRCILVLFLLSIFVTSSCSSTKSLENAIQNDERNITIQQKIDDEKKYKKFDDILDSKKAIKIEKMLNEANWGMGVVRNFYWT